MTEITFAESTIIATIWLIRFHPERLPRWLERHSRGLERVARERLAAVRP